VRNNDYACSAIIDCDFRCSQWRTSIQRQAKTWSWSLPGPKELNAVLTFRSSRGKWALPENTRKTSTYGAQGGQGQFD